MSDTAAIVRRAFEQGLLVPAFNVPYLPMVEPVVRAVADCESFGLIETARLEWYKFEGKGLGPVKHEYDKWARPEVRLHLDHVPVIDEDDQRVDYRAIIGEALSLGYESVMVDGSRLSLDENIEVTREAARLAHAVAVPCEAELGAVLGHEAGPPPPYEEVFASGRGFTDVEEARGFVRESGCDWLSVAVGNVHGAISGVLRDRKKVEARLNLEHLDALREATNVPLVLHGGSGVLREYVLEGIKRGIAKVNIGTEIRQAYEQAWREHNSIQAGQEATYKRTCWIIRDYFGIQGTRHKLL
ncbi:MAG TPA: class II fructose-bisphosphate aldolase [Candidatus Hydrogenedentes bacterium]|nr:class II fructose-bisphosphate aldolase [Candidatus Hydrogenedentota bacterium]HQH50932.1 class II fructose-bisphosphate aldolase [Candidatus Hydrogenedentota bacterium]